MLFDRRSVAAVGVAVVEEELEGNGSELVLPSSELAAGIVVSLRTVPVDPLRNDLCWRVRSIEQDRFLARDKSNLHS